MRRLDGHSVDDAIREGAADEADAVGERERRADDEHGQGDRGVDRLARGERAVGGLLADEAEHRGEPGHRHRRDDGRDAQHRHLGAQAAQLAQVTGAGRVVDRADDEEEARLEEGVREEDRHAGQGRVGRARAGEHDEEAELAHGAVGEEQLEVGLAEGGDGADDHRRAAQAEHDRAPAGHLRIRRGEARDEVDAGLDHRGGVQIRAHRGRGGHRAGQPEVEGHERRLAHRADEEEGDARDRHRARLDAGQHLGQAVAARLLAEQDDADEHREPAEGRDDEGLHRGGPPGPALGAMPDEQVGQDGRELPEDVEHQHVVAGHEPEHGPCEGEEAAREAPEARLVVVEVRRAVEEHEHADHAHDERHEPGEGVEAEGEFEVDRGDPLDGLRHDLAGGDRAVLRGGPGGGQRGRDREEPEGPRAQTRDEQGCGDGQDEVRDDEGDHARRSPPVVVVGGHRISVWPPRGTTRAVRWAPNPAPGVIRVVSRGALLTAYLETAHTPSAAAATLSARVPRA